MRLPLQCADKFRVAQKGQLTRCLGTVYMRASPLRFAGQGLLGQLFWRIHSVNLFILRRLQRVQHHDHFLAGARLPR